MIQKIHVKWEEISFFFGMTKCRIDYVRTKIKKKTVVEENHHHCLKIGFLSVIFKKKIFIEKNKESQTAH